MSSSLIFLKYFRPAPARHLAGADGSSAATGSLAPSIRHRNLLYALWLLPLPAWFLLGARFEKFLSGRLAVLQCVALGTMLMILLFASCGGGFTAPGAVQSTPSGSYQVTVIDQPAPGQQLTGFVQTSLIVPLTVNQVP